MITCTKCKTSKPPSDFQKSKRRKTGCASWCRVCCAVYHKLRWPKRQKRSNELGAARRSQSSAFVRGILNAAICADCPENDPIVLTFDHLEPNEKRRDVSAMAQGGWGLKAILEEIEKCEIVCFNCHMRREHKRRLQRKKVKK